MGKNTGIAWHPALGASVTPPAWAIEAAEGAAAQSPCTKSRRGAVLIHPLMKGIYGMGFNGPPSGFSCPHDVDCGKRCVHAEIRALRGVDMLGLDMIHVKIGPDGRVVAGGPPKCWQCSRELVDSGIVDRVWLYEALGGPVWRCYDVANFHRVTLWNAGL